MEHFKSMIGRSMKLLNEAESYASEYEKCSDPLMKEMYRMLGMGHLDMYNNLLNYVNRYVTQTSSDKYDYKEIWNFLKDYQDELYTKTKKKF